MIANEQLTRIVGQLIQDALQQGRLLSPVEVRRELDRLGLVFGSPLTDVPAIYDGQPIDVDAYNQHWQHLRRDLDVLYSALASQVVGLSRTSAQILASAAATSYRQQELYRLLAASIDVSDGTLSLRLDANNTNTYTYTALDDGLPATTATIHADGITLPFLVRSQSIVPDEIQITGTPLTGVELPLPDNTFEAFFDIDDTRSWMTQVRAGGGGADYTIAMAFAPTQLTDILVRTTHTQRVTLEIKTGTTWVPYTISALTAQAISGIRITLHRDIGLHDGDSFIYTFGIRQIELRVDAYSTEARVNSSALVPEHSFTHARLSVDQETPDDTTISYVLRAVVDETNIEIPILPNVDHNFVTLGVEQIAGYAQDVSGLIPVYAPVSRYFTHAVYEYEFPRDEQYGLFFGIGQWQIDYYTENWSDFPTHRPGPDDWDDTRERTVTTMYRSAERGSYAFKDQSYHLTRATLNSTSPYDFTLETALDVDADYDILCSVIPWQYTVSGELHRSRRTRETESLSILSPTHITTDGPIPTGATVNSPFVLGFVRARAIVSTDTQAGMRADVLNGPLANRTLLGGNANIFGYRSDYSTPIPASTTLRFTTYVYAPSAHTRVIPGTQARGWYAAVLEQSDGTALCDLLSLASSASEQTEAHTIQVYANAYLNGVEVVRTPASMTWSFVAGWNKIEVFMDCREALYEPILLGLNLLSSSGDSYGTADRTLAGVDAPSFSAMSATIMAPERVNTYDLLANTPPHIINRYALEDSDAGMRVYARGHSSMRIGLRRATNLYNENLPTSLTLQATLTTNTPARTPVLRSATVRIR